jgi:hypothetical protein
MYIYKGTDNRETTQNAVKDPLLSFKNIFDTYFTQMRTITMQIKLQRTALQYIGTVLKTLQPGEIRTHDLHVLLAETMTTTPRRQGKIVSFTIVSINNRIDPR